MNIKNDFIAIIPARAGSKGIPEKNIQLIGNKPMVQYTIEAAIASMPIENIIITSNDQKVIEIAISLGLAVPFIRPNKLSTDSSNTSDVIKHALNWYYSKNHAMPKNFILLQPTSPFRNSDDISVAINFFNSSDRKTLISVAEPMQHPGDFIMKDNDGYFRRLQLGVSESRRQMYPETFFIDGGIYISETNHFLKTNDWIGSDPDILQIDQIQLRANPQIFFFLE